MEIRGRRAGEIAASIEAAIHGGRLEPGQALPTVRRLAEDLEVSPNTAAMAYRSLQHRGLVTSSGRRGTRIARGPVLIARTPIRIPAGVRNLASGNPDPKLLPDLRPHLARIDPGTRLYGEAPNRADLLGLAAADFSEDGIPVDFMAVCGGALDAIERVLVARLRPGDRVAVEDPGYPAIADLLAALGLVAVPVPVDDLGPLPEPFEATVGHVAACILTPRAQNPFGSAIDAGRARRLAGALKLDPDLLLIEDDHAGPVSGAEAVTLAGGRDRWAVVRSVSKALGPDLRLALVTGDGTTISRLEARQQIGAGWVSHILQSLVVSLWRDPSVGRGLGKATAEYASRRHALLAALDRHGLTGHARSGLNVWVPVDDEAGTVRRLLDAGWAISAGERFRIRAAPAVRISIGTMLPEEAEALVETLARPAHRHQQTRSA